MKKFIVVEEITLISARIVEGKTPQKARTIAREIIKNGSSHLSDREDFYTAVALPKKAKFCPMCGSKKIRVEDWITPDHKSIGETIHCEKEGCGKITSVSRSVHDIYHEIRKNILSEQRVKQNIIK